MTQVPAVRRGAWPSANQIGGGSAQMPRMPQEWWCLSRRVLHLVRRPLPARAGPKWVPEIWRVFSTGPADFRRVTQHDQPTQWRVRFRGRHRLSRTLPRHQLRPRFHHNTPAAGTAPDSHGRLSGVLHLDTMSRYAGEKHPPLLPARFAHGDRGRGRGKDQDRGPGSGDHRGMSADAQPVHQRHRRGI